MSKTKIMLSVEAEACPYWDEEKGIAKHTCRGCEKPDNHSSIMVEGKRYCMLDVDVAGKICASAEKNEINKEYINREHVLDCLRHKERPGYRDIDGDYVEGNYDISAYAAIARIEPVAVRALGCSVWELKGHQWECQNCGCRINRVHPLKGNIWNYHFCPNCGREMDVIKV